MGLRSTGSGCFWRRDRHGGEATFEAGRQRAAEAAPSAVPSQKGVAVAVAMTALLCAATCRAETTMLDWFYGTPYQFLEVVIGDTVQWRWGDTRPHSVLGVGPAATEFTGLGGGNNLVTGFGFIYNHTFRKVGSYEFICGSDQYVMTGMIIVKPLVYEGNVTILWYLGQTVNGASAIINEGATVTWVWDDSLPHGLASDWGDRSVFPGLGGGTDLAVQPFQYKKTFTRPGYYLYHCSNHGTQMRGNITVRPKNGGPVPNAPPSVPLPPMPPSPHPPGFVQPPIIPPPPGRPFSPPPPGRPFSPPPQARPVSTPPQRTPPPPLKKLPPAGSSPPPPATKRPPPVLSKSPPPAKTPTQQPPPLGWRNPPPGWRPAPPTPVSKSPSTKKPPPALRRPPPALRRSPPLSVLRKLPPPKAISGRAK